MSKRRGLLVLVAVVALVTALNVGVWWGASSYLDSRYEPSSTPTVFR